MLAVSLGDHFCSELEFSLWVGIFSSFLGVPSVQTWELDVAVGMEVTLPCPTCGCL